MQTAISTFDKPSITIEGHTDSTGDSTLNRALSEERAKAVRQCLLSTNAAPAENLTVLGYGSSEPLASNKSDEGRAINRRIDVIINGNP